MIKLNFPQKNRAEHGAVISEEKQTLLSKRREKISLNFAKQDFISNSRYLIYPIESYRRMFPERIISD
jgi:hypothetical protein